MGVALTVVKRGYTGGPYPTPTTRAPMASHVCPFNFMRVNFYLCVIMCAHVLSCVLTRAPSYVLHYGHLWAPMFPYGKLWSCVFPYSIGSLCIRVIMYGMSDNHGTN